MRAFFGLVWDGGQSAWAGVMMCVMTREWVGICIFYAPQMGVFGFLSISYAELLVLQHTHIMNILQGARFQTLLLI
jgi:hypothetical protein